MFQLVALRWMPRIWHWRFVSWLSLHLRCRPRQDHIIARGGLCDDDTHNADEYDDGANNDDSARDGSRDDKVLARTASDKQRQPRKKQAVQTKRQTAQRN